MKKFTVLLLVILLTLSATGCAKPDQTTPETTVKATVETTQETQEETQSAIESVTHQLPLYAVSVPTLTEEETADDGTLLFNKIYQNISLVVPDPEIADKIIVDFLNRIDQAVASADTIKSSAVNDYSGDQNWSPYLSRISYDPKRIDSGVLSFFGICATYSGSSHPEVLYLSASYDLITGNHLSLSDILAESADTNALYTAVIESLDETAKESSLYQGYGEIVKDLFSLDSAMDESWYFSGNGLCFYFQPYEIAPYSSGSVIAEVPYDKLPGILNDAYFPAERQAADGTVYAELFDETALDGFTQIAEVILHRDSCKILLHADALVYDLCLETGFWTDDSSVFMPEHTIFSAYTLTPGDAIMLEANIPDTHPNIRLTYSVGGETVYRYITISGKDGSVLLAES